VSDREIVEEPTHNVAPIARLDAYPTKSSGVDTVRQRDTAPRPYGSGQSHLNPQPCF